jgi:hypothetical protein
MRRISAVLVIIFASLLASCSFNPMRKTLALCRDCALLTLADTARIPLLAYSRNGDPLPGGFIHVYLEGDGQPWLRGRWPAANPSSRDMVALQLMSLDANPSVYLNRPCYGHAQMPANCSVDLWTNGRYAEEVVETMALGLRDLSRKYPGARMVLLGHSGGGTLAMLLAQREENVAAVVTMAANLDHRAWTNARGFLPLDQSLNPADQPLIPEGILRWHLAGGEDQQVPAWIIREVADRDPSARFLLTPEFGHSCCWQRIWPALLQELHHQLDGAWIN